MRCPIYNRSLRQCRVGEYGCRCYIPFAALLKPKGWMAEFHRDKAEEAGVCWDESGPIKARNLDTPTIR